MKNRPNSPFDPASFVGAIPLRDDISHSAQQVLIGGMARSVIPFVSDAIHLRARQAGQLLPPQQILDEATAEFTRWTTQAIADNDDARRTIAAVLRHAARFALQATEATIRSRP